MDVKLDWRWKTHRPLLQALTTLYKPGYILEVGTGNFSTPIFIESAPKVYLGIDNDPEWVEHVKTIVGDTHEVRTQELEKPITKSTFLRELTDAQRNKIIEYYKELGAEVRINDTSPKLLFVDNYTCARTLAINTLYKDFDIVAYHDCEPRGIGWYEYYFEDGLKEQYDHYYLKTRISWTGCFIKKTLNQEKLVPTIEPFIAVWSKENPPAKDSMLLEKEKA